MNKNTPKPAPPPRKPSPPPPEEKAPGGGGGSLVAVLGQRTDAIDVTTRILADEL